MWIIALIDSITELQKESDDMEHFKRCVRRCEIVTNSLHWSYVRWYEDEGFLLDMVMTVGVLFDQHHDFFMRRARKLSTNG
jgi:hypothetical protein